MVEEVKAGTLWHVWCPEEGETETDARMLCASDPYAVAEAWAQETDTLRGQRCAKGRDLTVHVREVGSEGEPTCVVVGAAVLTRETAQEVLDSLRWRENTVVTNDFGERVWLKVLYDKDGKRIGITDCCDEQDPCPDHRE